MSNSIRKKKIPLQREYKNSYAARHPMVTQPLCTVCRSAHHHPLKTRAVTLAPLPISPRQQAVKAADRTRNCCRWIWTRWRRSMTLLSCWRRQILRKIAAVQTLSKNAFWTPIWSSTSKSGHRLGPEAAVSQRIIWSIFTQVFRGRCRTIFSPWRSSKRKTIWPRLHSGERTNTKRT